MGLFLLLHGRPNSLYCHEMKTSVDDSDWKKSYKRFEQTHGRYDSVDLVCWCCGKGVKEHVS